MTLKQEITGHYIVFWGVPKAVNKVYRNGVDFGVLEFLLKNSPPSYRFATNGMSSFTQRTQRQNYRTELYITSVSRDIWLIELLTLLATYPLETGESLSEFDTISISPENSPTNLHYTNLFLVPPEPTDSPLLGVVKCSNQEPVLVHRVIGITNQELRIAQELGGHILWSKLVNSGESLHIDTTRRDLS